VTHRCTSGPPRLERLEGFQGPGQRVVQHQWHGVSCAASLSPSHRRRRGSPPALPRPGGLRPARPSARGLAASLLPAPSVTLPGSTPSRRPPRGHPAPPGKHGRNRQAADPFPGPKPTHSLGRVPFTLTRPRAAPAPCQLGPHAWDVGASFGPRRRASHPRCRAEPSAASRRVTRSRRRRLEIPIHLGRPVPKCARYPPGRLPPAARPGRHGEDVRVRVPLQPRGCGIDTRPDQGAPSTSRCMSTPIPLRTPLAPGALMPRPCRVPRARRICSAGRGPPVS